MGLYTTVLLGVTLLAVAGRTSAFEAPSVSSTPDGNLVVGSPSGDVIFSTATSSSVNLKDLLDRIASLEAKQQDDEDEKEALKARVKALEAAQLDLIVADGENAEETAKVSGEAASTAALLKTISAELDDTIADLNTIVDGNNATSTCLADVSARIGGTANGACPDGDSGRKHCVELEDIENGKVHTHGGREVGSSRSFECNEDYVIVGKAHIFCGAELQWSAKPSCAPIVTCNMWADNWLFDVYADGVKLQKSRAPKASANWQRIYVQVTFAGSARVLGITAGDAERGCGGGAVAFACTSKGSTGWNGVSASDSRVQALGSDDKKKVEGGLWATDNRKEATDARKWPKAFKKNSVLCMATDSEYPKSDKLDQLKACVDEKHYSDLTSGTICADEDDRMNYKPPTDWQNNRKPVYWWVRVEL